MDRKSILETAEKMVNGDRQEDYGRPERSFEMIAELWSVYLKYRQQITGTQISQSVKGLSYNVIRRKLAPEDVAAMMILLKLARVAGGHGKSDNWIDIAGYAACGGELEKPGSPSGAVVVPGEPMEGRATHEAKERNESMDALFVEFYRCLKAAMKAGASQ